MCWLSKSSFIFYKCCVKNANMNFGRSRITFPRAKWLLNFPHYVDKLREQRCIYIMYLSVPLIFQRYEISRENRANSKGEIFDNPEATNQNSPSGGSAFSALILEFRFAAMYPRVAITKCFIKPVTNYSILYYIFSEKIAEREINVGKCRA